jgi:hypothetical protein
VFRQCRLKIALFKWKYIILKQKEYLLRNFLGSALFNYFRISNSIQMGVKIAYLHGLESNNIGKKNDWLRTVASVYDP